MRFGYDAPVTNFTLRMCDINGAGAKNTSPTGGLVQSICATGVFLVEYCRIRNAWYQHMQVSPYGGTSTAGQGVFHARYNSFENAGTGRAVDPSVHGDFIQFAGGTPYFFANVILEFNFNLQNYSRADTQGHSLFYSANSTSGAQQINLYCNVWVARTNINYPYTCDASFVKELNASHEWFDLTGRRQTYDWIQYVTGAGPFATTNAHNFSNQTNLLTGTLFLGSGFSARRRGNQINAPMPSSGAQPTRPTQRLR
jgi:hypothetical protein